MTRGLAFPVLLIAALLASAPLRADCVNPAGVNGEAIYNADHSVMQFCNGTKWISMAASGLGTEVDPKVGTLTNGKWCSSNGSIITCTEDAPVSGAGGSSGQVQYNNGTGLGGAAAVTYATSGDLLMLTAQAATDIPLVVKGAASQSGNLTEWRNSSGTALVVVDESGNVGIGTASPTNKLDVGGDIKVGGYVTMPTGGYSVKLAGDNSGIFLHGGTGVNSGSSIALYGHTAPTPDIIRFIRSNGTTSYTSMTIDASGNVGIGTTAPYNLLTINGGSHPASDSDSGIAALRIGGSGGGQTDSGLLFGYNTSSNYGWIQSVKPGTADYPLLLNPQGGNVGIGTTSPASKLDVAGTITATAYSGFSSISATATPPDSGTSGSVSSSTASCPAGKSLLFFRCRKTQRNMGKQRGVALLPV